MLVDKELKKQKQQVDKIEAEWSKAQKDLVRAKVAVSNALHVNNQRTSSWLNALKMEESSNTTPQYHLKIMLI